MEKFHEKLKILRKKKGLTQKDVADFFGVSLDWLFGRE